MSASPADAAALPASMPPLPPARQLAPGLWFAAGMIALYFALQAVVGILAALLLGIATGYVHGLREIGTSVHAMLAEPGLPAMTVMLTLGVTAAIMLLLVRKCWPALWPLAEPPGLGFCRPRQAAFFGAAIVVGVAAPLLGAMLTQWLAQGHPVPQDIRQLGTQTPLMPRLALVVMVASVGPLVEETLFRGVLLSALLQRWRVGASVAISATVFALAHLPGLHYHWYALPDLALLALGLAWLRLHSRSIWPAVLAHGVNNLLAVAAWFVTAHAA